MSDAGSLRGRLDRYPTPVALALGRLARAQGAPEQLDATIKAAEVVTRYVAVLSLASYSSRPEDGAGEPILGFGGPLSFGHFLGLIKFVAAQPCAHPLQAEIAAGFGVTKKRPEAPATAALDSLVLIRNQEGHDLRHMDRAKAMVLMRHKDPLGTLVRALDACGPLLHLPLFVAVEQQIVKGVIRPTLLLLAVLGRHVGDTRLIGGRPPMALCRRRWL